MRNGSAAAVMARRRSVGFTYISLIILVAIIGLIAATSIRLGATLQRAQAERDLLQIGEQFSDALKSYADATPAGQPTQPPTLQDLLKDPRVPGIRRHLRKIFVDPMTGRAEWGILYIADHRGILGIHSLSSAVPVKVGNFPARFQAFSGKQKISDWVFTFDGQAPLPPGQQTAKPGQQPTAPNQPNQQPGQPNPPTLFNPPAGTPSTSPGQGQAAPAAPSVPAAQPAGVPQPVPAEVPASEPASPPAPPAEPAQEPPPDTADPVEPAEPAEPAPPAPTER